MSPLRPILYAAIDSNFGVVVATDDPQRLRQLFYQERKAAADPALDAIIIATSRDDAASELWLIHKPGAPPPTDEET